MEANFQNIQPRDKELKSRKNQCRKSHIKLVEFLENERIKEREQHSELLPSFQIKVPAADPAQAGIRVPACTPSSAQTRGTETTCVCRGRRAGRTHHGAGVVRDWKMEQLQASKGSCCPSKLVLSDD